MYVYIYHICNRTYTATIILMVGIVWVRLKMGNGNFWSEIMINHVIAFFKSGANPKIAWKSRGDHGLSPVWVYIVRVWLKIHIVHYIYMYDVHDTYISYIYRYMHIIIMIYIYTHMYIYINILCVYYIIYVRTMIS